MKWISGLKELMSISFRKMSTLISAMLLLQRLYNDFFVLMSNFKSTVNIVKNG